MQNATLTSSQVEAVRVLGSMTRGRFRIWNLMGPHNASGRARLMSLLTGTKTPQSKAGVTMIQKAFFDLSGSSGVYGCEATREDHFIEWARQVVTE